MDGNPLTEEHGGWDVPRLPDLDAIQELHVEVNGSSAKYAQPTTLIMSSRSGTNNVHGALFYNNRNSAYGVARQRQDTYTKPPYVNRNEYGLSVGGPVRSRKCTTARIGHSGFTRGRERGRESGRPCNWRCRRRK